ncbi:hypothetical protein BDZ89DRAFT_283102 [Hymenopellis radicata]|nr:hypothetical protein BDZ89DRAFT_283102 [Hymenopellis radicata]
MALNADGVTTVVTPNGMTHWHAIDFPSILSLLNRSRFSAKVLVFASLGKAPPCRNVPSRFGLSHSCCSEGHVAHSRDQGDVRLGNSNKGQGMQYVHTRLHIKTHLLNCRVL